MTRVVAKRKRSSNSYSVAKKIATGLAQRGADAAGFGGAFRAARLGYRAARSIYKRFKRSHRKSDSNPFAGPVARKYRTLGKYGGRIAARRPSNKMDPYLRNGFKNVTEINGVVSDPNCVYVGHSTTSGHKILTIFLQSCLRKLYKQSANWTCTNVTDPIMGYETASDGWRLILQIRDVASGTLTEVSYDTVVNDTIYRIVGDSAFGVAPAWPDLYNFWVNYLQGAGSGASGGSQQPLRLSLYQRDGNITNFYHFMGDLYFPNERINLYITSEIRIQNRTLSATGSSDIEDVTNNPIIGRVYELNSGAPRTRVEGCDLLSSVLDSTGAVTRRAGEFSLNVMKEPPEAKIFWNLKKTARCRLEPGEIKVHKLRYEVHAEIYRFFQDLDWRPSSATIASAIQMKCKGKSAVFAFEDMINVNALQNISIAYEIQREEFCYLSTCRTPIAQGQFSDAVQNSTP